MLKVREHSTYRYYSLVRFDLGSIPSGVTIESAELGLYFYDVNASGSVGAYRITEDWSEGSVKWNNQPEHAASATDQSTVGTTGWESWDVAADVQQFIDGAETNYGWKMIAASGNVLARSKDYGGIANDPRLVITYR